MHNEGKFEPLRTKDNINNDIVNELKTKRNIKTDNVRLKTKINENDYPPNGKRKVGDLPTRSTTNIKSFKNNIGSTSTRNTILSTVQPSAESTSRKPLHFNSTNVDENDSPKVEPGLMTMNNYGLTTAASITTKGDYTFKTVTNRNRNTEITNGSTTSTSKSYSI